MQQLLGHALVVWLPKKAVLQNLPNMFRKAGYTNCCVILDCAEVFTEQSKFLDNQAITWSNYKHHSIIWFLVGISPNRFITSLSDFYVGRPLNKYIAKDSGFYDLYERGTSLYMRSSIS